MKIVVLGSNGMLGRYIVQYLKSQNKEVIPLTRKDFDVVEAKEGFSNGILSPGDVVINCAGIIKSQVEKYGAAHTIRVNSVFPYILEEECRRLSLIGIHVSTDCVFDGVTGILDSGYTELSPHTAKDVYGKSKSLGEPPGLTVIRTSIIGEEVNQGRSLIEWAKSQ
jgi:dTDP-4-dehydrorhamnose reductase